MPLIPGSTLSMNSGGVVSGTANSMALARGQLSAQYTVAPALASIDALTDEEMPASNRTAQKAKIVEAWNDIQAPLILADSQAICAHIATNLRMTFTNETRVQRLPNDFVAFSFCEGPNEDFPVEVDGAFS